MPWATEPRGDGEAKAGLDAGADKVRDSGREDREGIATGQTVAAATGIARSWG